jgi:hypothetical protein
MLEAHMGVYVTGRSGLIHEADVLVLLAEEAELSRQNQVPPAVNARDYCRRVQILFFKPQASDLPEHS